MFKGIIPGKRVASADITAARNDASKENVECSAALTKSVMKPTVFQDVNRNKLQKNGTTMQKQSVSGSEEMVQAFDKLLDELQIPQTLRPKLNGMDSNVKAAMLRSSHTLQRNTATSLATPKKNTNTLRKTRSSDSLASPPHAAPLNVTYDFPEPPKTASRFFGLAMKSSSSLAHYSDGDSGNESHHPATHTRGVSLDVPRNSSKAHLPITSKSEIAGNKTHNGKAIISPEGYARLLSDSSSLTLDVEVVKKLRLLLRNEPASWTATFLQTDGYSSLLLRLNELLEVEWREEQHDDQMLHELLRCFKALSTSEIGCSALRSASPTPFTQLVRLLYSDKKPGDVASRQLIAELLLSLFDLYPPSSLPSPASITGTPRRREVWEDSWDSAGHPTFSENPRLITFPPPHRNLFSLLRSLLLTKAPPPAEAPTSNVSPHEFIESLHIPRIFKTYLQELSDVCRDYFWVFCHPSNTIWNLDDTDERRVEKPRAPGGMTGGVEFEAMSYLTTHLKLLNAIAKSAADLNLSKDNELSAHRFHSDLFASGFERILLVARKASTTYYPTLHLEIARYVAFALKTGYELPWTLARTVGPPPAGMAKPGRSAKERNRSSTSTGTSGTHGQRSSPSTPAREHHAHGAVIGAPKLPTPKKAEPIRL